MVFDITVRQEQHNLQSVKHLLCPQYLCQAACGAIAVLEELVPSGDVEITEPSPNGQVIEEEEEVAADL